MDRNAIIENFGIDRHLKVSLREQLQEKLEQFIRKSEAGTALPTEKQFQEVLGISRVTVRNALMPLCRQGLLERCTGRGTCVASAGSSSASLAPPRIHEMAMGRKPLSGTRRLTLALYENIPAQKDFWEYTVNSFNVFYPEHQVEISWIPFEVTQENYHHFIEEMKPDLFQHECGMELGGIAHVFSGEMQSSLESGDLMLKSGSRSSLSYGCTVPLTYWNEDLAEQYGMSHIQEELVKGRYYELVSEALQKLPEKYQVSGHVWDCLSLLVEGRNLDDLDGDQLETGLKILAEIGGVPRAFSVTQKDPYDAVRNFVAGRQLLLTTMPVSMQVFGQHLSFRCRRMPVWLAPDLKQRAVSLQMSVFSGSSHAPEAEMFLKHLLSESIQGQLVLRRDVYPVRKSVWQRLGAVQYGLAEKEAERGLPCLRCDQGQKLHDFLIFAIRDDLADLLVRKVPPVIVKEQIMAKWRQMKAIQ